MTKYEIKQRNVLDLKKNMRENNMTHECIGIKPEVDEELLHEAIMTMLVRHKIKNLTKGDLKC